MTCSGSWLQEPVTWRAGHRNRLSISSLATSAVSLNGADWYQSLPARGVRPNAGTSVLHVYGVSAQMGPSIISNSIPPLSAAACGGARARTGSTAGRSLASLEFEITDAIPRAVRPAFTRLSNEPAGEITFSASRRRSCVSTSGLRRKAAPSQTRRPASSSIMRGLAPVKVSSGSRIARTRWLDQVAWRKQTDRTPWCSHASPNR